MSTAVQRDEFQQHAIAVIQQLQGLVQQQQAQTRLLIQQAISFRKRIASLEATATLMDLGRKPRTPGIEFRSQYGEDALAWELLGRSCDGFFLEAGAANGLNLSVSAAFEAVGWRGVLVEPVPYEAEACARNRPASATVHAALGAPGGPESTTFTVVRGAELFSSREIASSHRDLVAQSNGVEERVTVPMTTLDRVLEQTGHTGQIDLLVLDVEGGEADALRGLSMDRWRPRVMIIEDHEICDESPVAVVLRDHPYTLIGRHWVNRVYVRADERDILARAANLIL